MKILGEQSLPEDPKLPSDSPGRPWRFVLLVVLALAGVAVASQLWQDSEHDRVAWRHSYDQAVIESEETGKPLLVMFTADWCGPCKQMKAWVLSDKSIANNIEDNFIPLKVDLSREGLPDQHLADQFGVQAIPTMLSLTSSGQPISMSAGYMNKDEFLGWLDTATQRYAAMLKAQTASAPSATVLVGDDEHD